MENTNDLESVENAHADPAGLSLVTEPLQETLVRFGSAVNDFVSAWSGVIEIAVIIIAAVAGVVVIRKVKVKKSIVNEDYQNITIGDIQTKNGSVSVGNRSLGDKEGN